MGKRYPMSRVGKLGFCLGMGVTQADDCSWIGLPQTKYVDDMSKEFAQELGECDHRDSKFEAPGVHGQKFARAVLLQIASLRSVFDQHKESVLAFPQLQLGRKMNS